MTVQHLSGAALARERRAAGITQVQLARVMGITDGRVGQIETAPSITPRLAARFRSALGNEKAESALTLYELADELAAQTKKTIPVSEESGMVREGRRVRVSVP